MNVDLAGRTASGGAAEGDVISGFEDLTGSRFGDNPERGHPRQRHRRGRRGGSDPRRGRERLRPGGGGRRLDRGRRGRRPARRGPGLRHPVLRRLRRGGERQPRQRIGQPGFRRSCAGGHDLRLRASRRFDPCRHLDRGQPRQPDRRRRGRGLARGRSGAGRASLLRFHHRGACEPAHGQPLRRARRRRHRERIRGPRRFGPRRHPHRRQASATGSKAGRAGTPSTAGPAPTPSPTRARARG